VSDLRELYQEIVLDHNSRPRNYRALEDADRTVEGFNPLCGDQLTVYVKFENGVIEDVAFQGKGCAISRASSSLMTQAVKGKTTQEAKRIFGAFREMITKGEDADLDGVDLGDLEVLAGVADFPSRVKCASLGWHTLKSALDDEQEQVTTE
jgi:nitrogen fixation NifU-like protein